MRLKIALAIAATCSIGVAQTTSTAKLTAPERNLKEAIESKNASMICAAFGSAKAFGPSAYVEQCEKAGWQSWAVQQRKVETAKAEADAKAKQEAAIAAQTPVPSKQIAKEVLSQAVASGIVTRLEKPEGRVFVRRTAWDEMPDTGKTTLIGAVAITIGGDDMNKYFDVYDSDSQAKLASFSAQTGARILKN